MLGTVLIRLLKAVTALLPLTLIGIIGFVAHSPLLSTWYVVPLVIGLIPLTFLCWRLERFSFWLSAQQNAPEPSDKWQKLRLMALASLTCVALLDLAFTISFRDVQAPITAASVAIHMTANHMTSSFIAPDELNECLETGGTTETCTSCFNEPSGYDATAPATELKIHGVGISETAVRCHTKRIRLDGLSSLSCSLLMGWVSTGWLSRVAIGQHDAVSTALNQDYTALCHSAAEPISISLDYTFPPAMSLTEGAS